MLRNLVKTVNRTKGLLTTSTFASQYKYTMVPRFAFSENKTPRGFEKFKRDRKQEQQIPKENKKSEQKIEVEEAQEQKPQHEKDNEPQQEKKVEEEHIENEAAETSKKEKKDKAPNLGFLWTSHNSKDSKGGKGSDPKGPFKFELKHYLGMGVLGLLLAQGLYEYYTEKETITYTEFVKNYLELDKVKRIKIKMLNTKGSYKPYAIIDVAGEGEKALVLGNVDHFLENLEKYQLEKGVSTDRLIPVEFVYGMDSAQIFDRVLNVIYLGATVGILFMIGRQLKTGLGNLMGGGRDAMGMGKTQVQIYGLDKKIPTRFKDVAGLDEAKVEIMEFVEFLKNPKKFNQIGAKIPRGALLSGPPGTGKTLLAKAAAGEAGVPFLYISGSDFVEMFVGVGASRVRDLFKQAKEHAPSIIFIDEIDAVGKKRDSKFGGNDEKDNTLNQLLVEMDGFGTDTNVVVLAATNRKELLDSALTRPGRFDRNIEVTLPDIEGRKQIFMVHLKPLKLDPSKTMEEYAKRLATLTPGFSGADIHNLCNEAAILAARKGKTTVSTEEFEAASERVLAGLEKKRIISEEERKIVAVHESGHAVVSWFLEGGFPLLKLTIIPRSKGSLGFAQYLPNESSLETKEELLDRICCILGGRCAEEFFNGKVTTGAYDDLRKAYDIARNMVTKFGMSEKIGYLGFSDEEYVKKYSDETTKEIDREIKRIIDECTERTRQVVRQYQTQIKALSQALLEKETLDLQSIIEILGERPFAPKSNYKAYLEYKKAQEETNNDKADQPKEENIGEDPKNPRLKPKTA